MPEGTAPVSMSREELDAFLNRERPARLGVVATLRRDGSPQVSPVWYRWDGEAVTIWADEGRIWVENAKRDPRVAEWADLKTIVTIRPERITSWPAAG